MNRQLDLIYRHTTPDYSAVVDGQKCILVLRAGQGTCLVSLGALTPDETARLLPSAIKAEAEQLGREAHARDLHAAPVLDKRCMELVADMNPSGTVGANTATIIMKAWSRGWHAANAAVPTIDHTRR